MTLQKAKQQARCPLSHLGFRSDDNATRIHSGFCWKPPLNPWPGWSQSYTKGINNANANGNASGHEEQLHTRRALQVNTKQKPFPKAHNFRIECGERMYEISFKDTYVCFMVWKTTLQISKALLASWYCIKNIKNLQSLSECWRARQTLHSALIGFNRTRCSSETA